MIVANQCEATQYFECGKMPNRTMHHWLPLISGISNQTNARAEKMGYLNSNLFIIYQGTVADENHSMLFSNGSHHHYWSVMTTEDIEQ